MSHSLIDEIAKTSIQLMIKEPFYGHFFTSLLKDVTDKTESVAISLTNKQMVRLMVNADFWEKILKDPNSPEITKDLRYGTIKHQILHIVLKHVLRVHEFGNKKLFGIASDLAVNQYIDNQQLVKSSIRLEGFPEFKLDRGQGVDYYYNRLAEELNKMPPTPMGGGTGEEGEDEGNEGEGGDNNDENDSQGSGTSLNTAQQNLKNLLESESNEALEQHKFWEEFQKLSQSERKIVDAGINQSLLNSVQRLGEKMRGTLPAGLQQYIDMLLESLKPNVNWRKVLRLFAASSSRTRIKNTIRRASKRYGTTPGIKIQRKQKLLVAIDTSGSVSDDEVKEFFGEMYHIWKQGAEVFVVECDADIHNSYFYKGTPPNVISGRGGTDFNAPLTYANEVYMPDAIVYFTDGYCSAPDVVCRKPILWLISSNGINDDTWDFLPGRKVKMTKQV